MEIIKELHDDKQNVALIIDVGCNDIDEEELTTDCLDYIFKNYFKQPSDIWEEMNSHCMCDFTLRYVSCNQVLCYFNTHYNETFENKIIKNILLLNVDKNQNDLDKNDPLYQFRKFRLSVISNNLVIAPFVKKQILIHDVTWSR